MKDEYLLAAVNPGDETDRGMLNFLRSVPNDAEEILDSVGYMGTLNDNIGNRFSHTKKKHFYLFRGAQYDEVNKDYFSSSFYSAIIEIPDSLVLKARFGNGNPYGEIHTCQDSGTVEDIIRMYEEQSAMQPEEIIMGYLTMHGTLRDKITKKLRKERTKVNRTYVCLGIETPDNNYLLTTTKNNMGSFEHTFSAGAFNDIMVSTRARAQKRNIAD